MTEDNTTETTETQEGTVSEETALVKDLRAQLKEKDKQLKAAPSRSDIEAEVRAALVRESSIKTELTRLGIPESVGELVDGKLGDEFTSEDVEQVASALGFQVSATDESGSEESSAEKVAEVTSLGGQVQSAAQRVQTDDVDKALAEAKTPAEIAEIMRNAGLSS